MDIILADIAVPYCADDLFKKLGITLTDITPTRQKHSEKSNVAKLQPTVLGESIRTIFEGNRNATLTSLAGSMRRGGFDHAAIKAALLAANETQVNPPLPDEEVDLIVDSIMRYPSLESVAATMQSLNDVGNASRFVAMHVDTLRYVLGMEIWMIWQDDIWIIDTSGVHIMVLAKMTVRAIYQEAALPTNIEVVRALSNHANKSHNIARLKAMQEIAARDPLLCVPAHELDANPMLFGVANGVVNLITGKLETNTSDRLITRYSSVHYDRAAKCPTFIKFLKKIFKGDQEKIAFIRRIAGYCLTGRTDEQVFFFFFGYGANGKSTLLRIIELLLGPGMAKQTPSETLMAKAQGGKQSNDLARLHNVRVVIANEVEDGSLLAESLVKQMTGGDTVTARFLFKEFFEFLPIFKLIIAGNHKPIIKGTDNGIWRRTVMVDFPVSIPKHEQDPDLSRKLEAELPGILNWAIEGCLEWQKSGLAIPASVSDDIAEYREEMDWLGQWLLDCCIVGPTNEAKASNLYLSYKGWAESNGIYAATSTTFGRRLAERGVTKARRSDGQWYKGLSIKTTV